MLANSSTYIGRNAGEASTHKCSGSIQYGSWTDLQGLRDNEGLNVTSYGNDYNSDMSTAYPSTNNQARYDVTCGSLSRSGSNNDFNDWGFPEARGLFMWPSNQSGNTNNADVDDWSSKLTATGWSNVTPANTPCFSFVRL